MAPSTEEMPTGATAATVPNGNPIITHTYTADPTALVHGDTVYVYTGHDEAPPGTHDYVMNEWLCFSSRDLVAWSSHGAPLRAKDFGWSSGRAYASKVIEHQGAFYWFVSVADAAGDSAIAIAVSDAPTGPFTDHLGRPLVARADLPGSAHDKANLDPTVLVVDGTPHMVWGNGACYHAPLAPDLRSLAGPISTIELPQFEEGAHLHERDGWIYLSYGYGMPERVAYAMSRSIEGPWRFAGLLNEVAGNCATNRPCTFELDGDWYFAYHNGALPGGDSHHRSVCIDQLAYDADGTMQPVRMTSAGVGRRR